jgi:hypothetical protein
MRDLSRIDHARDWRSLAWKLERRHPGDFADTSKQAGDVNVNFNTGSEVNAQLLVFSARRDGGIRRGQGRTNRRFRLV